MGIIQYLLHLGANLLALSLPPPAKHWVALRVSELYFIFNRKGRKAVENNLRFIPTREDKTRLPLKIFHSFGKCAADFASVPRFKNWRHFSKRLEIVNNEYLDKAYREGKGVIALTAHIGNWEWGGVALALKGYPTSAIVLLHQNPLVDRIFVKKREEKKVKIIPLGTSFRESYRRLKKGEVVAILGDRNIGGSGIEVNFFGKPAYLPKGPAALAYRTGASIVPGFVIRKKDNRYTLYFEPALDLYKGKDREEFIRVNTQKIAQVIEKYILLYPEQWVVFEKIWKD